MARQAIPGLDVTELRGSGSDLATRPYRPNFTMPGEPPSIRQAPPIRSASTALAVSNRPNFTMGGSPAPRFDIDAGPGNPNVPRGGSVEARNIRAANAGPQLPPGWKPPVEAAPATPAPAQGLARTIRGAVTDRFSGFPAGVRAATRAVAPGLVGAGLGLAQRSADADAAAQPETPFTPPVDTPGQIPIDPSIRAPASVPQHPLGFGPDNELTRNLANAANALPGTGPAANVFRAGSNAAKVFGAAATGAPAAVQVIRGAQSVPPAASAGAATASAPPPNPLDQRLAAGTAGTPAAPINPAGTIRRDGNSYSGADIKFGADIDNPRNPGAGVTSLDTSEGTRQDQMELARIRASAPVPAPAFGFGGEQVGMARTGGTAGLGPSLSTLTSGNLKPRDIRHMQDLAAQREVAGQRVASEQGIAAMREGGETGRALINANTQRDVAIRGQDITREGHYLSNGVARAQARYQAAKDQRQYELEREKFGVDVANSNRSARAEEEKSWQSMAENRFRTRDGDGKDVPDHQKIAEFNTAVDTTLPSFIKLLQQTGTPAALQKAQQLSLRGKAALGPDDHDLMQRLLEKRSVAKQTHGLLPGKSSYIHSDDLLNYLTAGSDTGALGNAVDVARNGTRTPVDKLRYGASGNVFLPNFQPPNTNLTSIR